MDKQIFKRINKDLTINVNFYEENFELTILNRQKSWLKTIKVDELKNISKQFNSDIETYFETLKECFTKVDSNVEFKFENGEFLIYRFTDGFKVKYFTCKLKEINHNDCVNELLDKFYSNCVHFNTKFNEISKERDELLLSKKQLETILEEFITRKTHDEDVLYSNFCLVLNEKKKRIQHLNELLLAFKKGRPTVNPPAPTRKTKKSLKEEVSDSNSDNEEDSGDGDSAGYNTDEEKRSSKKDLGEGSGVNNVKIKKEIVDDLQLTILPKRKKITEEEVKVEVAEEKSPGVDWDIQDVLDGM